MTRTHPPCSTCAKFVPAKPGTGDCTDHDRPANADDPPCVLYLARGSWAHKKQQRAETISRASA